MRVIFLDIDGVLNGNQYLDISGSGLLDFGSHRLNPDNIARLNTLVSKTGADIVISSSWRIRCSLFDILAWFKERGFTSHIFSATPRIYTPNRVRGDEIKAWLQTRDEKVESFVILDDADDMAELVPHLVQTDNEVGLTDANVEAATKILIGS
jgi:hypothetical protein